MPFWITSAVRLRDVLYSILDILSLLKQRDFPVLAHLAKANLRLKGAPR